MKSHDMDALRDAKPEFLETATPATTRLRELNLAMAQPQPSPSKRKFRPAWGLGALGAVAAGTAAAAVLLSGGGAQPVTPSPPSSAAQEKITLGGRDALLAAAFGSEKQPATSGKWWHSARTSGFVIKVKGAKYQVVDRSRGETWTPFAPDGQIWNREQRLGFAFPTEADEAAWKAAGSPQTVTGDLPGKTGGGRLGRYEISKTDGQVKEQHDATLNDGEVFWLGRNVTVADLRKLPADPKALKANLLRWYGGHDTESDSVPMDSDAWLYRVSVGLIAEMPVTPKVRGAAFRMLAGLKTVKVVPDVATADGRTGTAVTIQEKSIVKTGGTGLNENRLIFDIATGTALQTDSVVVEPGTGNQRDIAPGTVWTFTTYSGTGWTDQR